MLGAAGSAADNYAKCIRGHHHVVGADVNGALLPLSCAHRTVTLSTRADDPEHVREISMAVAQYAITYIHAAPDEEVLFLAGLPGNHLHGARFDVPREMVVRRCQDKLMCATFLGDLAPRSFALQDTGFEDYPMWLRLRRGAGSAGAVLAAEPYFAREWVDHWSETDKLDWMVSEYLPGPDKSWTAFYRDGKLVTRGMRERVQYMGAARSSSGQTSTYQVGRLTHDSDLDNLCRKAVGAVDDHPHGWFYVDTKGHEDGRQLVTEINAGRPNTTVNAWFEAGLNMPLMALETETIWSNDYVNGSYLRQPDMGFRFMPDESVVSRAMLSRVPIEIKRGIFLSSGGVQRVVG